MAAAMKRVENAIHRSKIFVAPALIVGAWVAMFGAVAMEMTRAPLNASIEKVLAAPAARPGPLARRWAHELLAARPSTAARK